MLTREDIEQLMRQGADAFAAGMQRNACQYAPASDAFATWMRGYQNAAFGAAMNQRSAS